MEMKFESIKAKAKKSLSAAMRERSWSLGGGGQERYLAETLGFIDRWDVREVGTLIKLFPDSIPAKFRSYSITAYMAGDEDSTWMVSFDRPESLLAA